MKKQHKATSATRKLTLSADTIRILGPRDLTRAAVGASSHDTETIDTYLMYSVLYCLPSLDA